VPCEVGHVARVAELFSFVLSTNYGRIFDVRTKPSPANLAFSDRGLGLHTDNPYRDPVPTLQLLHCLVAAPDGGLSRFLDGVAFARRFRRTDRVEFDLLATVAIDFTYEDETDLLTARSPIIELDAHGEVAAIRHNSRSARPPASDADSSNAWYAAYRSFAHQLEADPSIRELALQPGDLVCFDNRRVLHGRTAFTEVAAPRHLQGCYAAMDAVRSRLAAERLPARFA
jgi:gamma-butyrobetaine dioxygenase